MQADQTVDIPRQPRARLRFKYCLGLGSIDVSGLMPNTLVVNEGGAKVTTIVMHVNH